MTGDAGDRTELWLSLLRRLSDRFPNWGVRKNVGSALEGVGDIDSFAPRTDWPGIQHEFVEWATDEGLGPVLVCRHEVPDLLPGVSAGSFLHVLTVQPGSNHLLQLDVKDRSTFRGSTLLDVDAMRQLWISDERGFRRVRSGAEAVFTFCTNGSGRGGRENAEALEAKGVHDLLRSDPEGVRLAIERFGPARPALQKAIDAYLAGGWDRASMLVVEGWTTLRSLAEPGPALGRAWFGVTVKDRCPVLTTMRKGHRRVDGDPVAWIRSLSPGHDVIEVGR